MTTLRFKKFNIEAYKPGKSSIKKLIDWKDISEFIPSRFKESDKLKKTGLAGIFAASLELSKEGLISIMQKKNFDKLLIKERK